MPSAETDLYDFAEYIASDSTTRAQEWLRDVEVLRVHHGARKRITTEDLS